MTNVDEVVAAVRTEIEAWRDGVIQQIRAEHAVQMQAILARAKTDMGKALDNALQLYRQSLQDTQNERRRTGAQNPELAKSMEKVYVMMDESARKGFEQQVEFIKDMYKRSLGIT